MRTYEEDLSHQHIDSQCETFFLTNNQIVALRSGVFGKTFHRIISQISRCRPRSPTSKFYSRSAALAPFRHQILISMQFV